MKRFNSICSYLVLSLFLLRFLLGEILRFDTHVLTVTIFLFFLISIDYTHFNVKTYFPLFFLFILGFAIGNQSMLMLCTLVLVVVCCKKLTIREAALFCFFGQLFILIFMAFCAMSGVIPIRVETFEKGITYDMGFGNSNGLSVFIFSTITSMYIGLKGRINTVRLIWTYLFISCIAFYFTKGRTYFIGEILFLVSFPVVNFLKEAAVRRFLPAISLIPLIVMAVILYILFNIGQFEAVTESLTGRPAFWFVYLDRFLESDMWVGYDLAVVKDELEREITLDCSYLTMLFATGILGYTLFSYLFFKAIYSGFSYIYHLYFPLLIAVLIAGLTENIFMSSLPINLLYFMVLYNAAFGRRKTDMYRRVIQPVSFNCL